MKTLGISIVSLVGLGGVAAADGLSPAITGHLDGTYNYNLLDPAGGTTLLHSYTAPHNTFLLNAAHVSFSGKDETVAYNIELDAGSDAAFNSFTYGSNFIDVQEAWVSYAHDSGLGMKAGKFVTTMGIEVIENTANPTISRGFLFGLAEPATHVGAMATYVINDTFDVAVGAINGWDLVVDNNSFKSIVAKVGITTDKALATISAIAGPEQPGNKDDWRIAVDATAVVDLDPVALWLQGNFGRETFMDGDTSTTWMGFGVQPVITFDDKLSLGLRGEVFIDGDGATRTGTGLMDGVTVINGSVCPGYKLADDLTLRLEGRLDFATEDIYADVGGDVGAMQIVALTEVLYSF